MARILAPAGLIGLVFVLSVQLSAAGPTLTLQQAIELAVNSEDPSVTQYLMRAQGLRKAAEADAQLPDPRLRFGIANLAIDTFDFRQEPMTQLQLGLHQSIPSKGRRQYQRARGNANSDALEYMARNRELALELEVERRWLQLLHLQTTRIIVETKKQQLIELLNTLESQFKSGQTDAHRILAVEAELALLDDRLQSLDQARDTTRAKLSRYIGIEPASRVLAGRYSEIAPPMALQVLEQRIGEHPDLLQEQARIRASDHAVSLAREDYKPNWGVDVGYGYRAAGRADFASAMVTLDVPLFTAKRQDKRLSAAKQSQQAARLNMQAKKLEIIKNIRASYAIWRKSSDRIELYETVVLQRTDAASVASENAYISGTIDFAEVIRTHIGELDARLKLEAIKLERALAQAQLKYYAGGRS